MPCGQMQCQMLTDEGQASITLVTMCDHLQWMVGRGLDDVSLSKYVSDLKDVKEIIPTAHARFLKHPGHRSKPSDPWRQLIN